MTSVCFAKMATEERVSGTRFCDRYRHEIAHDGQRIYILGGGTSWMSYPLNKVH